MSPGFMNQFLLASPQEQVELYLDYERYLIARYEGCNIRNLFDHRLAGVDHHLQVLRAALEIES